MDDIISRQALLKEIDRASRKYSASFFSGLSVAADIIAKQPPAERPKGKWIRKERTIGGGYCTNCECDLPMFMDDWTWKYCETKFCPNCGAEMEMEE